MPYSAKGLRLSGAPCAVYICLVIAYSGHGLRSEKDWSGPARKPEVNDECIFVCIGFRQVIVRGSVKVARLGLNMLFVF